MNTIGTSTNTYGILVKMPMTQWLFHSVSWNKEERPLHYALTMTAVMCFRRYSMTSVFEFACILL